MRGSKNLPNALAKVSAVFFCMHNAYFLHNARFLIIAQESPFSNFWCLHGSVKLMPCTLNSIRTPMTANGMVHVHH